MMETSLWKRIKNLGPYLVQNEVGIFPLISFRILFAVLMIISTIRFWANGWIESLYLAPSFFFKYYGFYWIPEPSEIAIYSIFVLLIVSSLGIMIGLFYRLNAILFFLLFTYIELIDASNYLNHYYFVSIVDFLLIFLPANRFFSLDSYFKKNAVTGIKAWQINIIKFQIAVVYVYAGIAKINPSWISEALPLKIWLPSKVHVPVIGELLNYQATAYFFSWGGLLFDLFIVFFLIYKPTRIYAYLTVVVFHLVTWVLFPIGIFPFVMIASTLIFFSESKHQRIYPFFKAKTKTISSLSKIQSFTKILLVLFVSFQLLFPFRYLLYEQDLFWTEQGYRFSWRVMLMEKAGYANFTVKDGNGKEEQVDNSLYLQPFQEKMMSTQGDFIIQYAHHLADVYTGRGLQNVKVYADVFVSINGKPSTRFIRNDVNLLSLKDSFKEKEFFLPAP